MNMKNRLATTEPKTLQYYKGVLMHADEGLHEQAYDLFQRHVPAGASVIDVGAGAGAFSRRLADAGYHVTGLDVDESKWLPKDIPFRKLDLDKGVREGFVEPFDAACCMEVIEHVENPWTLLRDLHGLLRPGGKLLLSTPNITSFLSRLLYFRTGRFHQFTEESLNYGHINPMTAFEVETVAARTGWRLLSIRPGGYLPIFDFTSCTPRALLWNLWRGLAFLFARGYKNGWCLLFVFERIGA
jgi:SAM-dependent methyltransferase